MSRVLELNSIIIEVMDAPVRSVEEFITMLATQRRSSGRPTVAAILPDGTRETFTLQLR